MSMHDNMAIDVILLDAGANKIGVIKEIREITGLGMKEAKALVAKPPNPIKIGVSKDDAYGIKRRLEEAGARVEIGLVPIHDERDVELSDVQDETEYRVIFKNSGINQSAVIKVKRDITVLASEDIKELAMEAIEHIMSNVLEYEVYEINRKAKEVGLKVEIWPDRKNNEEKTEYDVILTSPGTDANRLISVIYLQIAGLGLKEVTDLVEGAPKAVKTGISKGEALEIKKIIEENGGKVEIKEYPKFCSSKMPLPVEEEKTEFDVILTDGGATKIAVIKEVRYITGRGLRDAQNLVTEIPQLIKSGVSKDEALEIKKRFEEMGAKVEIR